MYKKFLLFLSISLFLFCMSAHAQRTAYGERMLSVKGAWTISSLGGELQYGQYLMNGFWFGGLNLSNRVEKDEPTSERVHFPRLQLNGGYMFRLFGSRTRAINIYGGGDAFIGVEMFDFWKILTSPTRLSFLETGFSEYRFIYGVAPRAEAEFFVFPSVALLVNARIPICFNTKFEILGWELGGGVKINF